MSISQLNRQKITIKWHQVKVKSVKKSKSNHDTAGSCSLDYLRRGLWPPVCCSAMFLRSFLMGFVTLIPLFGHVPRLYGRERVTSSSVMFQGLSRRWFVAISPLFGHVCRRGLLPPSAVWIRFKDFLLLGLSCIMYPYSTTIKQSRESILYVPYIATLHIKSFWKPFSSSSDNLSWKCHWHTWFSHRNA